MHAVPDTPRYIGGKDLLGTYLPFLSEDCTVIDHYYFQKFFKSTETAARMTALEGELTEIRRQLQLLLSGK